MRTDKLLYGAAYYDEYMPYDRIETDFQMMKDAGMNVIRIAESTWSTWEPHEGQFDFTHLTRMLDCATKYGLDVIVGTPTYAIPSWLANKADDMLALTHDGPSIYGHRQNMDITNPIYLEHAKILIEKLMDVVTKYDCVIGYQLDNETKPYDTCGSRAQAMFVERLKKQYPDINEFNHEFGLDYWSNRINSWEDFPDIRGTINQSLHAEYRKFQRDLVTEFLAWQADIVNKYRRKDQFITQNFDYEWHDYSFGLQPEVNQYEAAKCMDVAGCDIYHPSNDLLTGREITACGNIARGIKNDNYLVLETEAQGNIEWLSYPGQLRLQAYSHIANGADMVEYWHWHSIHNAIESYWKGVLSHDLAPNRTYRECSVVGNEWKRIGSHLVNLKKKNRVAVIASNEALTGLVEFPMESKTTDGYNTVLRWLCDALYMMNIEYDIIWSHADNFSDYDYLFVPALYSASEKELKALDEYALNGGNLLVTFKSGFSDEHLKIYHDTQPHILNKTLGIKYDQFTYPANVKVSYNDVSSDATEWMELVTCDTAESLCKYGHKVWNTYSAVTLNHYGSGRAMYLGAMFGENTLIEILKDFFKDDTKFTSNEFNAKYPIVIKRGINDLGKEIVYLLNYSDKDQSIVNHKAECTELISDCPIHEGGTITLAPWDVAILEF